MQKLLFLLVLGFSIEATAQQSLQFPVAKFHIGDSIEWKNLGYDDTKWPNITTTERWEKVGYPRYDGYAWYRIKFVLPSSLKNNNFWQDSLTIMLGRIDDADETFFNGVRIGKTGSFATDPEGQVGKWDVFRVYNIAANSSFINWDKENVIAVRVSDFSGGGGMFGKVPYLKMLTPHDKIELNIAPVVDNKMAKYRCKLSNTSAKKIEGQFIISVKDEASNKAVKQIVKPLLLNAFQTINDSISAEKNIRYKVSVAFKEIHAKDVKEVYQITPYILTPKVSDLPRINNATVFGVRPNSPFIFKVAATGQKPLHYSANQLPKGLVIDSETGIISGVIKTLGSYDVSLTVTNKLGKCIQKFTIKVGQQLALTPPMGWNSWNSWALSVSEEKVKSSAQAIIDKGLIDHGWSYINIDDGWENASRDKDGNILSNTKFPDMVELGNWLHHHGLKFGIYSSPGTKTCGNYLGSYQHELQDAITYTKWGIDYLKYDWCSYEDIFFNAHDSSLAAYKKPYVVMQQALQQQPRDIVYSLCQYGMKDVWQWGASVNGNSWRTTDDIRDTWQSVYSIGFIQAAFQPYAKPGNWNDPDILVVGNVGWSEKLRPTRLTSDEQYTHISLWCMLAAPLLIGCDVSTLDDFTLSLLTNDEIIAINQDALGMQAIQKIKNDNYQVWVKQLADGSMAVAMFNMDETFQNVRLDFSDIGLNGDYKVRDVWQQKNLGSYKTFASNIPPHGVTVIKLTK